MLPRQQKAKHSPNPINFHIHHVPKALALLVFTFCFLIIGGESQFSSCLSDNPHSLLCFAKLVYIFSHLFGKMHLPKPPPEAAVFAHVFLSPESAPSPLQGVKYIYLPSWRGCSQPEPSRAHPVSAGVLVIKNYALNSSKIEFTSLRKNNQILARFGLNIRKYSAYCDFIQKPYFFLFKTRIVLGHMSHSKYYLHRPQTDFSSASSLQAAKQSTNVQVQWASRAGPNPHKTRVPREVRMELELSHKLNHIKFTQTWSRNARLNK